MTEINKDTSRKRPSYISQVYYSKEEKVIKRALDKLNFIEGISYIHNVCLPKKMSKRKCYYWIDFYLPEMRLAIEVSPDKWHKDRPKQDAFKKKYIESLGVRFVSLNSETIERVKSSNLLNIVMELLSNG
jgi:hypothetical protein